VLDSIFEIGHIVLLVFQAKFLQLIDSEAHYNAVHKHSCSICKKSFPTGYLLELHVTEMHDSFFKVRGKNVYFLNHLNKYCFKVLSAKEPSFECFLEKCPLKFWNPHDRRQHSIKDHSFPTDFKFDIAEKGSFRLNFNSKFLLLKLNAKKLKLSSLLSSFHKYL